MHTTLGAAIRDARMRQGWTQPQLASRVPVHVRLPSYWERDEREPDMPTLQRLIHLFDDPAFTLAAVRHLTGGLFGSVAGALCGVRTKVAMAMAVEIEELRDDLKRVRSDLLQDDSSETIESVYCNVLDVLMTCNQMVVELTRDYGLSLRDMQRRHLQEVKAKRYVHKKKSRPGESRAA